MKSWTKVHDVSHLSIYDHMLHYNVFSKDLQLTSMKNQIYVSSEISSKIARNLGSILLYFFFKFFYKFSKKKRKKSFIINDLCN